MQHKDFTLSGRFTVKVFLIGDFDMLDVVMGHQRSASFPSIKDLVTLNHFKTHSSTPHNPENCNAKLREISDFMENFVANVADDRVGTNKKKRKHDISIIGTLLICITSPSNIVSLVLHITLGIVLKLFEMILSEVRKLDWDHFTEVQKKFEKEWEVNSNELKRKEDDRYKLFENLLDFMKFTERLMAKFHKNI